MDLKVGVWNPPRLDVFEMTEGPGFAQNERATMNRRFQADPARTNLSFTPSPRAKRGRHRPDLKIGETRSTIFEPPGIVGLAIKDQSQPIGGLQNAI